MYTSQVRSLPGWQVWASIEQKVVRSRRFPAELLLVDGRADQSPFVSLTAIEVENRRTQETHKRETDKYGGSPRADNSSLTNGIWKKWRMLAPIILTKHTSVDEKGSHKTKKRNYRIYTVNYICWNISNVLYSAVGRTYSHLQLCRFASCLKGFS